MTGGQVDWNSWFTAATVACAVLKVSPIPYLIWKERQVRRDNPQANVLDGPLEAFLYFTSKLSGILAAAFALAAAASAGKDLETFVLSIVLVLFGAATFWSMFARFRGRFHGLIRSTVPQRTPALAAEGSSRSQD